MTHLTKAEPRGLFTTTVPQRPNRETGNDRVFMGQSEAPFAVSVDTTPDEARRLRDTYWPGYEWPSVSNLPARTRGKHY